MFLVDHTPNQKASSKKGVDIGGATLENVGDIQKQETGRVTCGRSQGPVAT